MDQMPTKSSDHDSNNNSISLIDSCHCTNISIMQLFHEMKQEFPKVPDHIVQQLVTENCHNRRACLEQLQKAMTAVTSSTPTMYPSKLIHKNSRSESPVNGLKTGSSEKMRAMTEKFENNSSSSSCHVRVKRPTTLPLRPAPDPPAFKPNKPQSPSQSTSSTPNSTTSVSSFSNSYSQQSTHHSVVLDSSASKVNDSLNVQLNVKVSPVTTKRPAPPPPVQRYTSHLSVQPEPPYTSMLAQSQNNLLPMGGGAIASSGTTGQRSYTNVKLTLRQPSTTSALTPIDIQAGPQKLIYSSSSFNAQQGCESHLKITVAGNESCIQAVRTAKNAPDINQIDTTINIEGNYLMDENKSQQYRIVTNPQPQTHVLRQQLALPQSNDHRLTEDELRQLIRRQRKQKELLESELEKEREKLQMIRLDIITLTSPMMTQNELRELCDEITRLRTACGKISNDIDVVTTPQSYRALTSTNNSPNLPPPIPKGLVSRKSQSPCHSISPHFEPSTNSPSSSLALLAQPPSYHEAVASSTRRDVNSISNNIVEEKWTCTICTFRNHHLLNICETCEMPRVSGIKITSSSFRPLFEMNQLQSSITPTNNDTNASCNKVEERA